MKITPQNKSPLRYLDAKSRKKFIDRLTFNKTGVTGYSFEVLKQNLTAQKAGEILALFGLQNDIPLIYDISRPHSIMADDQKGKWCNGGICEKDDNAICKARCGSSDDM